MAVSSRRRTRRANRIGARSNLTPANRPADRLDRFVDAQQLVYRAVVEELRAGQKASHWMWFVFPQITGLGYSLKAWQYGITSLDEARSYLAHPVLGPRLRECARLVLDVPNRTAIEIFGSIDAKKLRSCMTLFMHAAPDEPVFPAVLDRFFDGHADPLTEEWLRTR